MKRKREGLQKKITTKKKKGKMDADRVRWRTDKKETNMNGYDEI